MSEELKETSLTHLEWQQAILRLLALIEKYILEDHPLWLVHYNTVQHRYSQDEKWPLWLAYDIEVRRQAICNGLDLSKFQSAIYDTCRITYEERNLLSSVQIAVASSTGVSILVDTQPADTTAYPSSTL